jgi:hypothetical protein
MSSINIGNLFIFVVVFVGLLFLMRAIGAWMLRIDEVISLLKEIRDQLKKNKSNQELHLNLFTRYSNFFFNRI